MNLNKNRSFQEIFTDTFVFLQQEWRTFFGCIAIYAAPVSAVASYFSTKVPDPLDKVSSEMLTFLIFAVISNFLLQSIAYCYIVCFAQNGTPTHQTVLEFFTKNIFTCIKAFFISSFVIGLGILLYIVPGVIALAPLSLFAFDKIYTGSPSGESLSRSMKLTQSNVGMSYAVVLLSYAALLILQFFVGSLFSGFSTGAQILINTVISVLSSTMYIIVALLYFSLRTKIQKPYDNYQ